MIVAVAIRSSPPFQHSPRRIFNREFSQLNELFVEDADFDFYISSAIVFIQD